MTVATRTRRAPQRPPRLRLKRGRAVRVWSTHPWLDAAAAAPLAVAAGYAEPRPPAAISLAVAVCSGLLAVGWSICLALTRRLSGMPVPGFGHGFPRHLADVLTRIAVQGLLLAAAAGAVCAASRAGWAGWIGQSWAVVLFSAAVTSLGCVRCTQTIRPLTSVTLHRR